MAWARNGAARGRCRASVRVCLAAVRDAVNGHADHSGGSGHLQAQRKVTFEGDSTLKWPFEARRAFPARTINCPPSYIWPHKNPVSQVRPIIAVSTHLLLRSCHPELPSRMPILRE